MGLLAKYRRHFIDSWKNEALFKGWLTKANDSDKAYCKICKRLLRPHKCDLEKHALTKKHISKANQIVLSEDENSEVGSNDSKLNRQTKKKFIDWKGVCLVCLRKNYKSVKPIFVKDFDGIMVSDKISECSTFQIQLKMNIPNTICINCYKDLQAAYRFRKNCEKSNKTLEKFINRENLLSVEEFIKNLENFNNDSEHYKNSNKALGKCINQEDPLSAKSDNSNNNKQKRVCVPLQIANTTITRKKNQTESLPEIKKEESDEDDESSIVGIILENYDSYLLSDSNTSDCNMKNDEQTVTRKAVKEKSQNAIFNLKPVYVCHICGNALKNQYSLNIHMKRHLNIKSHKCEICCKAFVLSHELINHMRIHTGEKPYKCKYCEKRYADFSSRQRHERTHTGERPYKCGICKTTFSYPSSLKRHQKIH